MSLTPFWSRVFTNLINTKSSNDNGVSFRHKDYKVVYLWKKILLSQLFLTLFSSLIHIYQKEIPASTIGSKRKSIDTSITPVDMKKNSDILKTQTSVNTRYYTLWFLLLVSIDFCVYWLVALQPRYRTFLNFLVLLFVF